MDDQKHYLEFMAVDVTEFVPEDDIHVFYCPESWIEQLSAGDGGYKLKLRSIGDELSLFRPELLSCSFKRRAVIGEAPMFYSLDVLPVGEIHEHFVRHGRASEKGFRLRDTGRWEKLDVTHRPLLFEWLPGYLARKFVERRPVYEVRDKNGVVLAELDFCLVKKYGEVGCITRPCELDGKYYSYAVYFSIQTFPHRPGRFYLFVKPVLHRYVSRSLNDRKMLRRIKRTSVFLRLNRSVLHPFVSLEAKKADQRGESAALMEWERPKVVEDVNRVCEHPLTWESLLNNPVSWMNHQGEMSALMLYNPNTFVQGHDIIASGLGLPDRRRLYELVRNVLALPPSLVTTKTVMQKTSNVKFFPLVTSEPLKIDVQCHVTKSHFDALIQSLSKTDEDALPLSSGCRQMEDCSFMLDTDKHPLILRLRHIPESHVVREINRHDPSRTVTEIRRYIRTCIEPGDHLKAAIIEIKDKDKWSSDQLDPKEFVRYAFWEEGVLTQFITDEEQSLSHRAHSAVSDLLKDFGVFRQCLKIPEDGSKWLFVKGSGKSTHPKVWIARLMGNRVDFCLQDSRLGWQSAHELVLNAEGLRRSLYCQRSTKNKRDFVDFIEEVLSIELESGCENLFVVFDRGTLSKLYDPVQNKCLLEGKWRFERKALLDDPRLKIIRMSDSTSPAVPEYISRTKSKPMDHFSSGLYISEDIYYSLGPKGDTIRFSPKVERSFTVDEFLRQPNLQEFFPVGTHWDKRAKTDAVIHLHRWRRASVTYKHATIYPAPMHSLETIEKYMSMFLTVEAQKMSFQ
ncbi:pPIWI_RE module domain-containing protein [Staphylospora marina]|uniref:pPIWI_RE module domain-containing protein n=1 Tax=Staphylospora marina TaxID=2490858 RepID=UPI000F5B9BDE|nr:DUF3962 domain-containing protein [Staphylospora marina]